MNFRKIFMNYKTFLPTIYSITIKWTVIRLRTFCRENLSQDLWIWKKKIQFDVSSASLAMSVSELKKRFLVLTDVSERLITERSDSLTLSVPGCRNDKVNIIIWLFLSRQLKARQNLRSFVSVKNPMTFSTTMSHAYLFPVANTRPSSEYWIFVSRKAHMVAPAVHDKFLEWKLTDPFLLWKSPRFPWEP